MRIRWVFAAAVALGWGCQCEGKSSPQAPPLPKPPQEEAKDPGASKPPRQSTLEERFVRPRDGFVKATIEGKTVDFRILPEKTNRVVIGGPASMLLVDAVPIDGSSEHLTVRVQGTDLQKSKGRSVVQRPGEQRFLALVTYVDPDGAIFVGKVGPDLRIGIGALDAGTQTVDGTFSGTLSERRGERTVQVEGGAFKTSLAKAAPSAGDAPP